MPKQLLFILSFLVLGRAAAAGIPAQITYQGTLKQQGAPITKAMKTMLFRITNADGSTVYYSTTTSVLVTNGLFSTTLSPTGLDWQNITPYIEVSVEGQMLLPREPVTATIYAVIAGTVVDGGITTAKLDSNVQSFLVPQGAIMIFDKVCPATWIRYSALDNRFPYGTDPNLTSPGTLGGNSTHNHSVSIDGGHSHTLNVDGTTKGAKTGPANFGWSSVNGALFSFTPGGTEDWSQADKSTTSAGAHNHGGFTGNGSSIPPFVNLVFCQKQ